MVIDLIKIKPGICNQKAKMIVLFCVALNVGIFAYSNESYELILDNFEQLSEHEIQFDLLLHNSGATFYFNDLQAVINFNTSIIPQDGFFEDSNLNIIPESSELLYPPIDNNFFLVPNGDGFALFTGEPMLNQAAQKVNNGNTIKIARLQIILSYKDGLGAFLDCFPDFDFNESFSFAQKCPVDSNGNKNGAAEHLGGRQLLSYIPIRPLASHYFSGNGNWDESIDGKYVHWNAQKDTHQDFAFNLPTQNNNVIIAGTAYILSGESILLKAIDGVGGRLTIITGPPPQYIIALIANGFNAQVKLLDEESNELENPSSLEAGTSLFLQANTGPGSGLFLNWTDQHGNVLSTESLFGPYEMPAEDMEITANWSSGSKTLAGGSVPKAVDRQNTEEKPHGQGGIQSNKTRMRNLNTGLVIEPGGALTVETIYNDHEAGAEAVVLQSAAGDDAAGSLIHQNQGVEATVERFIDRWPADNPRHGWHLLSSPVKNMPIRPEFVPVGEDGTIPPWVDFYKWDEAHVQDHEGGMITGWWINSKLSGGIWNPEFEDHFQTGRGYLMAYGPQSKGLVRSFTGELEVSDVPVTNLTHAGEGDNAGWHLLGNPFASALDWTRGDWQKVNITGGPKIWHEAHASYTPVIDIIPAMNGFMIRTSGNGSLQIPAEARVHDPTGWYKENRDDAPGTIPHIILTAHDPAGQTAQETVVVIRPDAVAGFDPGNDTPYLPGYAPLFYSISDNTPLALNNQPEFLNELIIPMGFQKNTSTEFYISLTRNLTGMDLTLEDLLTGQMHPLSESQPYHFSSSTGDPVQRFNLHVKPGQTTETPKVPIHELLHAFVYQKTIFVNTTSQITTIQLFDIRGRMLKHQQLHGCGQHTLKYDLPPGIYVARLSDENRVVTVKVML